MYMDTINPNLTQKETPPKEKTFAQQLVQTPVIVETTQKKSIRMHNIPPIKTQNHTTAAVQREQLQHQYTEYTTEYIQLNQNRND